jgi:hypothetical protein
MVTRFLGDVHLRCFDRAFFLTSNRTATIGDLESTRLPPVLGPELEEPEWHRVLRVRIVQDDKSLPIILGPLTRQPKSESPH